MAAPHLVLPMDFWYYFWTVNFLIAGAAFALIALVVSIRGLGDLRRMFDSLRRDRGKTE